MPTIAVAAYATGYCERADLVYNWQSDTINRYGFRTHSIRPGDGAQWDSSRQYQFTVYGFRRMNSSGFSLRRLFHFLPEGPHDSNGMLIFSIPLENVTITDAQIVEDNFANVYQVPGWDSQWVRIYGVAVDNFTTLTFDKSIGYPQGYRTEFHYNTWGRKRRYRAENFEYEMPHTEAITRFRAYDCPPPGLVVPNLAPIVNEIMSRQPNHHTGARGWRANNKLAFITTSDVVVDEPRFAPDLTSSGYLEQGPNASGWLMLSHSMAAVPIKLVLTYE